jgi:hypothetical protein
VLRGGAMPPPGGGVSRERDRAVQWINQEFGPGGGEEGGGGVL